MLRFSDYTLDVAFFSILDKLTNPYRNFLSINNKRIFSNTKKNYLTNLEKEKIRMFRVGMFYQTLKKINCYFVMSWYAELGKRHFLSVNASTERGTCIVDRLYA